MPELHTNRRLDQPRLGRRRFEMDPDGFARVSERIARFLGTGRFLVIQSVIVAVWIALNLVLVGVWRWDPYPFILLNLAFSTQAAYAAPLILLAQNRQDDRDRVSLEEDRSRAERTKADTEYLARELAALRIALGEVATRDYLRGELDRIAERLDMAPRAGPDMTSRAGLDMASRAGPDVAPRAGLDRVPRAADDRATDRRARPDGVPRTRIGRGSPSAGE